MFEAVTIRPCEWDVLHPLDGRPLAVVRLLILGPNREPYYRAVSPEPKREQRRLIGYWGSLEHAHDGVLALYEHLSRKSLSGGDMAPTRALVVLRRDVGDSSGLVSEENLRA